MIINESSTCDSDILALYVNTHYEQGRRIMSMFASEETDGHTVSVMMRKGGEITRIVTHVKDRTFPSVTSKLPSASQFEKKMHEMSGLVPEGHPDLTPAVYWRKGYGYPLQKHPYNVDVEKRIPIPDNDLSGSGVFEIPVGPVHAGVIQPGHFRFSAAGEPILELKVRLGFTHKGVEKLMENGSVNRTALVGRISGDNTVAHSLAHALLMEGGTPVPPRAEYIRVVLAEIERIHNHLDVMSGLCTDSAFSVAAAYGAEVRERLLRVNRKVFGSRMLMNCIVPGGVKRDIAAEDVPVLIDAMMHVGLGAKKLNHYIDRSPSITDRLETTGILTKEEAESYGTVGVIARASGVESDVREELPYGIYDSLSFRPIYGTEGDVMARKNVRAGEISESVSLVLQALSMLSPGEIRSETYVPDGISCGIVESPRGELIHTADIRNGEIWRYDVRDPSFVNWPAMETAVLGDIVPDFPLINKSFGLSYSGNDV